MSGGRIFATSNNENMAEQSKATALKNKKDLARLMYMQKLSQDEIALRVGVSRTSISKWVNDGKWEEARAALNVTRPEIVNKNLLLISRLLDRLNTDDIDLKDVGKIVDQISKLASAIERIDKKTNIIDTVEVFTALDNWLIKRMEWDKNITPELVRTIDHYHQLYISELAAKNGEKK